MEQDPNLKKTSVPSVKQTEPQKSGADLAMDAICKALNTPDTVEQNVEKINLNDELQRLAERARTNNDPNFNLEDEIYRLAQIVSANKSKRASTNR